MSNFSWLDSNGQVSEYVAKCATLAMSVIDLDGSPIDNVNYSYKKLSTNGVFTSTELAIGGRLLIDVGLVVEENNLLRLSNLAKSLRNCEENHLKQVILVSATRLFENESKFSVNNSDSIFSPSNNIPKSQTINQAVLEKIGAAGEEFVLQTIRSIFLENNQPDLAKFAKRVSLISDEFGYDIEVTTPSGIGLFIEVKSSVEIPKDRVGFYVTRHESLVSRNSQNWFLVFCYLSDIERPEGEIIGWIDSSILVEVWPIDSAVSSWELSQIFLDKSLFRQDFASLILS